MQESIGDRMKMTMTMTMMFMLIGILHLSASASNVSSDVRRPVIEMKEREEMILDSGANVTLRCFGQLPVIWIRSMKGESPSRDGRMTVVNQKMDDGYESFLQLTGVKYLDTGEYRCEFSTPNSTTAAEALTTNRIYLYVYDGQHLMASKISNIFSEVFEKRRKIISECRATHPGVTVTCQKRFGSMKPNDYFDYDPKFGIIISTAFRGNPVNDESFECDAKFGNLTEKKIIYIAFRASTVKAPLVNITALNSKGMTVKGKSLMLEDVTFRCTATVRSRTQILSIRWSYPLLTLQNKTTELPATRINRNSAELITSELIVRNITQDDSGMYCCSVTDHDDKTGSASYNITVYENQNINLILENPVVVATVHQLKVTLVVHVISYYDKPRFQWYQNNEAIIDIGDGKYRNVETNELTIFNVNTSDAGIYTLCASGKDVESSVNVTLNVNEVMLSTLGSADMRMLFSIILPLFICFVLLLVLILVIWFLVKRRSNKFKVLHLEELLQSNTNSKYNEDMPLHKQTDILSYDTRWEFPKDRLKFDVVIGKGAFGTVYRAEAFGINKSESTTTVAVKTVKDSHKLDQLKALVSELKVLIHLGQHVNILNALGAVTQDIRNGCLYVIMEYCRFGCLRNHLINSRTHFHSTWNGFHESHLFMNKMNDDDYDDVGYLEAIKSDVPHGCIQASSSSVDKNRLTIKELICYAFQIARGLEYLHSRKYIHRDIAARNVLLADNNVVKICDFGLSKDCYKYNEYHKKSDTPVPIKWMALESLTHDLYTAKSDIWSYGVFLWELFTLGGNPYPTLTIDKNFINLLKLGYRLEKPSLAQDNIYECMLECWDPEPRSRPSASQLVEMLGTMLESTVRQHYIDLKVHSSVEYARINVRSDEEGEEDAIEMQSTSKRIKSLSESGFASCTKMDDVGVGGRAGEDAPSKTGSDAGWESMACSPLPSPCSLPDYQNSLLEHFLSKGGAGDIWRQTDQNKNGYINPQSLETSGSKDSVFDESSSTSYSPTAHAY